MRQAVWLAALALFACGDDPVAPPDDGGSPVDSGREEPDAGPIDRAECAGPFSVLPNIGAVPALHAVDGRQRVVAAELGVGDDEVLGLYVDAEVVALDTSYVVSPLEGDGPVRVVLGTACSTSRLEDCARHWTPVGGTAFVRVSRLTDEPPRFWMTVGELVLVPGELQRAPLAVVPTEPAEDEPACQAYTYVEARLEPIAFACGDSNPAVFCELAE